MTPGPVMTQGHPSRSTVSQTTCPVCHEASWQELEPTDQWFRLFRCAQCACLLIEHERPPLPSLYDRYYAGRQAQRFSGVFQWVWRWLRRWKARHILRHAPPNAVVCDVGCERGELLNMLKEHGCRVVGTQLSRPAAEFARRRFGIDVFLGELWDAPFAHEAFDVILMVHMLEHLPQPEDYLAQVRRMVKPGGTLWVEVPNCGSFTARVCGKRWLHHDPEHHLWNFNATNLTVLLQRYGFVIEQMSHLSWEHGPIGCLQSWLNFLPGQKNMLFQVVRRGFSVGHPNEFLLQAVHVGLSLFLLPAACLVSAIESLLGNGQTVLVMARRVAQVNGEPVGLTRTTQGV